MTAPRLMTQAQAAQYCSLSPVQFNAWVKDKRVPGPIEGTHRWDKVALDRAIDNLSGIEEKSTPEDALEKWKRNRDARRTKGAAQDKQIAV